MDSELARLRAEVTALRERVAYWEASAEAHTNRADRAERAREEQARALLAEWEDDYDPEYEGPDKDRLDRTRAFLSQAPRLDDARRTLNPACTSSRHLDCVPGTIHTPCICGPYTWDTESARDEARRAS